MSRYGYCIAFLHWIRRGRQGDCGCAGHLYVRGRRLGAAYNCDRYLIRSTSSYRGWQYICQRYYKSHVIRICSGYNRACSGSGTACDCDTRQRAVVVWFCRSFTQYNRKCNSVGQSRRKTCGHGYCVACLNRIWRSRQGHCRNTRWLYYGRLSDNCVLKVRDPCTGCRD